MLKSLHKIFSPRYQKLFLDYPVRMQPRYGHGKQAHPELEEIINRQRAQYVQLLTFAAEHQAAFLEIKTNEQTNKRTNEQTNKRTNEQYFTHLEQRLFPRA